jgi:hypothetical protein
MSQTGLPLMLDDWRMCKLRLTCGIQSCNGPSDQFLVLGNAQQGVKSHKSPEAPCHEMTNSLHMN